MLDQYLAHLLSSLNIAPGLVYLIVFLAAIIEALPAIGTFFPGHTIIIFSGILVVQGVSGLLLAVLASLGAIIGDGIAYFFGRRYGERFINHRRPAVRKAMKKSHEFFEKYGFFSLILGRFTPVTRAFIPVIAGSSHMEPKKFWIANVIGGILWGTSAVLLGYAIGKGYSFVHKIIGIYAFLAILGVIMFYLFYIYVARRLLRHPHVKRLLLSAAMITIFFLILDAVGKDNETSSVVVHELDLAVRSFAVTHQAVPLLWEVISLFGSTVFLWPLAIIVAIWLRNRKRELMFFSAATIIGLVLDVVIKAVIGRMRPGHLEAGYSFPSGHALMSTVIYGALFVILWRMAAERPQQSRLPMLKYGLALLPLLILLICASRILLNYHWFTDVIGGLCLGIGIIAGVLFFQQFFEDILEKK
jgi:membrane protein DedA with SNARE-associated domain